MQADRTKQNMNSRAQVMRVVVVWAMLSGTGLAARAQERATPSPQEGLALALVYDTSGSMKDPVPDAASRPTAKFQIANRALRAIIDQLETYQKNAPAGGARRVEAGLVVFRQHRAHIAVNYGALDGRALRAWADGFSGPEGATPLGDAVRAAGGMVLNSRLTHKHVLVVTDGMNTAGADPAQIIPQLNQRAAQRQTGLSFHFVAFDIDAKRFDPLKSLHATVLSAADERQLNSQLEFILQRKILLEEEEPPAKPDPKKP
jgi:Mg-chelatase subunit ChlD